MSKMQKIIDQARKANQSSACSEAIEALIKAVELLARGQQQIMADFDSAQRSRTDIPIGAKE